MTVLDAPRIPRSGAFRPVAPPLEQGDCMERPEFERRYARMTGLKKAELLEGKVYVPSPVSLSRHGEPHLLLSGLCSRYLDATPWARGGDNCTLRLDLLNEPQPDLVLFRSREHGGSAWVDDDGYLSGAPELVIEIASSSRSYDLHEKKEVYRRHGIAEYLGYRVDDEEVDWFVLDEGDYRPQEPGEDGLLRSCAFPGFQIDLQALVTGDRPRLAAVLDAGLAARP